MGDSVKQIEVANGSHICCRWSLTAEKIEEVYVRMLSPHLKPNGLEIQARPTPKHMQYDKPNQNLGQIRKAPKKHLRVGAGNLVFIIPSR